MLLLVIFFAIKLLAKVNMSTSTKLIPIEKTKTYRATSGERNFIELIKAPISLEAVLAIEIM